MYPLTKQAQVRILDPISEAVSTGNATLVGTANLNQAYRIASLGNYQFELNSFTNGAFIALKTTVDGDTGTFEIWGYPEKGGAAQFLGTYTFTTDECVDDDGLYYVDAFVESVTGQHTVTILNFSDGRAVLKLDTLGLKYIICYPSVHSSSDTPGYITFELRPW